MPDESQGVRPGVRIPPPLVLVAVSGLGWLLNRFVVRIYLVGGHGSDWRRDVAGWAVAVLGVSAVMWGARTFSRHRTPVSPFEAPRHLVTSGPYRFSRNPIYIGLLVVQIGAALITNTAWLLVLLPLSMFGFVKIAIAREERALEANFGEPYRTYKQHVRRWI